MPYDGEGVKIITYEYEKLIFTVVAAVLAASVQAATYYVDAARLDDSGDGLTPETAKRHIQAAVDLCASSDTVKVAEGVYNEGENVCHWDNRVGRVIITNRVNLVASGRKEKTIIDGGGTTMGIHIYYSTGSSAQKRTANSIVRGFTITNCRNVGNNVGAALSMWSSYAVDCVISNNVSSYRGAGTYLGTAIRCLFADNSSSTHGSAMYQTVCLNCLIIGQRGGQALSGYAGALYNCTVAGNNISSYSTLSCSSLYNTIYVGNTKQSIYTSSTVCNKCIFSPGTTNYDKANSTVKTNDTAYCFVAPMLGDWRPTRDSGAAEFGDASYHELPTLPPALEDERYVDYMGKPIPKTGAITCGAVQEVGDVEGPLVTFDRPYEVEGCAPMVANDSMSAFSYCWADDRPGMTKFRCLGLPFEKLVWYNQTTDANTERIAQIAPALDNWAGFVPYPGCTNHIKTVVAGTVYYVDAENGSDSNAGTSRDAAFATIQTAIDKLPTGKSSSYAKSTIVVAPGVYTNAADSTSADYIVDHYNKSPSGSWVYRRTRIVAEEGPEKTVIDGCGHSRCAQASIETFLQGFTLTGATGTGAGTGFNASSTGNGLLADCIISNNYVFSEATTSVDASIVRRGRVVRCRFSDNRVNAYAGGVVIDSDVMDCDMVESVPRAHKSSYLVASSCNVAFSTLKGSCHSRSKYYYSILPGGQSLEKEGVALYCYANGSAIKVTDTKAKAENCLNGKPGVISWAKNDFRLRPDADVLGKVTIDPAIYTRYAQLDLDLNPLSSSVLSGNTMGARQLAESGWTPPGVLLLVR